MKISIVYICNVLYPGQIEKRNITFGQPEDKIIITHWSVPGVEKPTEEYLQSLFAEYERPFKINELTSRAELHIARLLDTTAQSKQYDSALSCISYTTSTNIGWAVEARAFINWRDALFVYFIKVQSEIQQGAPIPSFDEFVAELPTIVWP